MKTITGLLAVVGLLMAAASAYATVVNTLMFEPVVPVTESGTMVLLGSGLLALGIFNRRRLNK